VAVAGALLAQQTPRLLRFTVASAGSNKRKLTITSAAIDSIDVYVNTRPVATTTAATGTTTLTIPATSGDIIRIEGYDTTGKLVAASQQDL
jgi:hypothetical protein